MQKGLEFVFAETTVSVRIGLGILIKGRLTIDFGQGRVDWGYRSVIAARRHPDGTITFHVPGDVHVHLLHPGTVRLDGEIQPVRVLRLKVL